jgi:hypothetical protein
MDSEKEVPPAVTRRSPASPMNPRSPPASYRERGLRAALTRHSRSHRRGFHARRHDASPGARQRRLAPERSALRPGGPGRGSRVRGAVESGLRRRVARGNRARRGGRGAPGSLDAPLRRGARRLGPAQRRVPDPRRGTPRGDPERAGRPAADPRGRGARPPGLRPARGTRSLPWRPRGRRALRPEPGPFGTAWIRGRTPGTGRRSPSPPRAARITPT